MSETCPEQRPPDTVGRMIATQGSRDLITHGGGRIFDTGNGVFFEYTYGTDVDDNVLEVYRTHLADDLCAQFERLLKDGGLEEMCECMDAHVGMWKRKARGRLQLRARCLLDLANHFGWEEIDPDPMALTQVDLQLRWYREFSLEGPVTSTVGRPRVTVPELLLALKEIDETAHDALFSRQFPLIPTAALQNMQISWWDDVGGRVEDELIRMLQTRAPFGFTFSLESGIYGFWPIDGR